MNVRDSAALVIATLAESKPNSFKRDQPLLQHMQEVVFPLIQNSNESAAGVAFDNNPAWRIDDEDNDDNDPSLSRSKNGNVRCTGDARYTRL